MSAVAASPDASCRDARAYGSILYLPRRAAAQRPIALLSTSSALHAAAAEAAPSPGDAAAGVGLDEPVETDEQQRSRVAAASPVRDSARALELGK
jgi:hypothetical protein